MLQVYPELWNLLGSVWFEGKGWNWFGYSYPCDWGYPYCSVLSQRTVARGIRDRFFDKEHIEY
jgi:hypothetical protein